MKFRKTICTTAALAAFSCCAAYVSAAEPADGHNIIIQQVQGFNGKTGCTVKYSPGAWQGDNSEYKNRNTVPAGDNVAVNIDVHDGYRLIKAEVKELVGDGANAEWKPVKVLFPSGDTVRETGHLTFNFTMPDANAMITTETEALNNSPSVPEESESSTPDVSESEAPAESKPSTSDNKNPDTGVAFSLVPAAIAFAAAAVTVKKR